MRRSTTRGAALSRRAFVLAAASAVIGACSDDGSATSDADDDVGGVDDAGSAGGQGGQGGSSTMAAGGDAGTRDAGTDAMRPVECNDATGLITIERNHGHHLLVSRADAELGVEKTYDIQGVSAHSHLVTLTAADFAALARGDRLSLNSTVDAGHDHVILVDCDLS